MIPIIIIIIIIYLLLLLSIVTLIVLFSLNRNLVSASQDGKLIVWDAYTTNKVSQRLLYYLFIVNVYVFY